MATQTRRIIAFITPLVIAVAAIAAPLPPPVAPYDSNPDHVWNRLHRAIFARTAGDGTQVGHDALDPLLYGESKFLRSGDSHKVLLDTLDEFLASAPERQINDPLKSAILQRDLWAVFDWAQRGNPYKSDRDPGNRALMAPLAKAIRRLALSAEQRAGLPDALAQAVASQQFPSSYDPEKPHQPFLPDDLLSPTGPWVALAEGDTFAAKTHVVDFRGRTAFDVFLNLPGGRKATINYLAALREAKNPLVNIPPTATDNRTLVRLSPDLPEPPKGTRFAILRRTLLIDGDGTIRSTPVVESLQIRVFRDRPRAATRGGPNVIPDPGEQDRFEFVRSRAKLFASDAGGLRAIIAGEQEMPSPLFRAHLFDPLEFPERDGQPPSAPPTHDVLNQCVACHPGGPLQTFQSLNRFPAYPGATLPRLAAIESNIFETDAAAVVAWKTQQEDWKALAELMKK
ncbi:MAG: hypothetical protein JWN40_5586 [Phycisphaerales bacterium]|nr:hypothetical protein [Phycisphaerales bacterium]